MEQGLERWLCVPEVGGILHGEGSESEGTEGGSIMFRQVADHQIQNVWVCPECEEEVSVTPDWYQDNGTPVCCECDVDMNYSHVLYED